MEGLKKTTKYFMIVIVADEIIAERLPNSMKRVIALGGHGQWHFSAGIEQNTIRICQDSQVFVSSLNA